MSVTLGGKRLSEFGIKILQGTQEPGLPETRNQTLGIAGRHGLYDFGAFLGARTIELSCALIKANPYTLQDGIRQFAAHMVDGSGRPKIMDLVFDSEPDKVYRARYAGNMQVERLAGLGRFTLPLVAYDPFAYLIEDAFDVDVDSDVLVDTYMTVDAVYTHTVTGPASIEIDNFGTQNAQPIIEITGNFTTLSITAAGKTFNYGAALTGQTLVIDCAWFTARIGATNKLGDITGDFIELPVGVVPVSIGGTGLNCTVNFKFKPKFI